MQGTWSEAVCLDHGLSWPLPPPLPPAWDWEGHGQSQGLTQGLIPSLPLPDSSSSGPSLSLALTGLQLPSCYRACS